MQATTFGERAAEQVMALYELRMAEFECRLAEIATDDGRARFRASLSDREKIAYDADPEKYFEWFGQQRRREITLSGAGPVLEAIGVPRGQGATWAGMFGAKGVGGLIAAYLRAQEEAGVHGYVDPGSAIAVSYNRRSGWSAPVKLSFIFFSNIPASVENNLRGVWKAMRSASAAPEDYHAWRNSLAGQVAANCLIGKITLNQAGAFMRSLREQEAELKTYDQNTALQIPRGPSKPSRWPILRIAIKAMLFLNAAHYFLLRLRCVPGVSLVSRAIHGVHQIVYKTYVLLASRPLGAITKTS